MIVADLIRALEDCDPNAIVLIPRDTALTDATEWASDMLHVSCEHFITGPAAAHGAVRLVGFPVGVMVGATATATASVTEADEAD